jgi:signal transduction histidine kinase
MRTGTPAGTVGVVVSLTKAMSTRSAALWLAWLVCALSLVLTALGLLLLALNRSHPDVPNFEFAFRSTVIVASCSTVGVIIASLRPAHPIGWLFSAVGLIGGMHLFCGEYAIYALVVEGGWLPGGAVSAWIVCWLWVPLNALLAFVALLFPDGKLPSPRWRAFGWLNGIMAVAGSFAAAFLPGPGPWIAAIDNPFGVEGLQDIKNLVDGSLEALSYGVLGIAGVVSLYFRFRRAGQVERQQIKWLAYAGTVLVTGAILLYAGPDSWTGLWIRQVGFALWVIGFVGVPVAMGIAILKYRLYDIDIVINRTLVYGTLSASVVGIYILAVGGLGMLFQSSGTLLNSLVGTGVVAIVFAPLRDRLQRGVNRLMYGERDDPYAVISRLGQRLEATLEPRAMLPTIVETVAQALKLPYVAIALKERNSAREENGSERAREQAEEDGSAVVASWGSPVEYPPLVLPLAYGHETIGELILAPRARGEDFAPTDRRLLEDLARQTEVAAYAVRLTDDLQRARERLVTTREEERRRLRRDLHDGLGPQLSGQALTIDAIRSLLKRDPAAAEELLVDLKAQTRSAAADIRRLVYALRPPALDSLGLVGALRKRAAQCEQDGSLRVYVEAPEEMPPLPAAVEVACYRIGEEALTNVVRHAQAQSCALSLAIGGGALRLEVRDGGRGLPDSQAGEPRRAGVGLTSMRERATELGGRLIVAALPEGGTVVRAELPLAEEEG